MMNSTEVPIMRPPKTQRLPQQSFPESVEEPTLRRKLWSTGISRDTTTRYSGPPTPSRSMQQVPQGPCQSYMQSEGPDVKAARAVLATAACLPLPRRQDFLVAASELPEIAAIFEWVEGEAATQVEERALEGLQARLQGLADKVRIAPPPPPPLAPGAERAKEAANPVPEPTPEPGEATLLQPAEGETAPSAVEKDALKIELVPEYEQYGVAAGETVRSAISVKAIADVPQRARVSLSCVLDRSGSMSGRILLVQQTTHFLIDQLSPDDCLGISSFSSRVSDDVPLLHMSRQARALAHRVVDAMRDEGSTALYDGLVTGVRQQMEAERQMAGEESRVVHSCFLFTDGAATDGPTSPEEIISGLQALQGPTEQHITVHTFGFGQDHSVDLLQRVAQAQAGVYYYISCNDDIAGGFGDALGGLLAVVAKDIQVAVRPASDVILTAFRSGGRVLRSAASLASTSTSTTTSFAGFRSKTALGAATGAAAATASVNAPEAVSTAAVFNDMFAEESRECLLTLTLPSAALSADSGPTDADADPRQPQQAQQAQHVLAEVDLSYTDIASGRRVQRSAVLRVLRSGAKRPAGQLPAELVFVTAARFETLDAIEDAQLRAFSRGGEDVSEAHAVLDQHMARLKSSPIQSPQVQALTAQTRAARESIKPRSKSAQADVAAMAGHKQALLQQRIGTSTVASPSYHQGFDFQCKKNFRSSATETVSSKSKRAD